jgi:hypothetical protein
MNGGEEAAKVFIETDGNVSLAQPNPTAGMVAGSKPKSIEIEAVIIRADGAREDLGTVCYWNKNPLKRLWWSVKQRMRR